MTSLERTNGDDPLEVLEGIRSALDGGPALGLGMLPAHTAEVPAGTAAVIATSGSSGIPKQVVLSADALRASAQSTAARIGSGRWVLALPAGYVAGLQVLVRSLLAGTHPAMLDGRFTPQSFAAVTLQHAGGHELYTSLVPAQLSTLLDDADDATVLAALRAYRAILIGGQALPAHVRERASDLGVNIVRTYGSSETAGGCVYDGVPLDGVAVREVEGELRIAGRMLASGYLADAALTDKTFVTDADGVRWYRTGDHGLVEDGVVRVHGRIDNVIVSGGINVSLDRVERVVRGVPGLEQAVVVGIPDERWGEASAIFVARGSGDSEHLFDDARARVSGEIGKHARPVQLEVVPELPLLASGKPDREAIRRLIAG
ncbi:AMP-binding protein [Microbacterium sp. H1-D42]|uniref:AMP-binding protein n=1 Tax=Microbacterium sp. H1-D42 TaxID=2925844 RepID=UPI001F5305EF|nr:AMP-binding protein [Microbacterium sp. H1-D42]UNK70197.1 AMP-binding protein [Microbacterium sp. H1-D42]